MKAYGKKVWLIPDAFLSSASGPGEQPSHEAICVINTGSEAATLTLTLLYEDRNPIEGITAVCGAARTNHIRMDRLTLHGGGRIPRDTPYSVLVESTEPVVIQYSRLDTSSTRMALMTTIAFPD